jgi:hypothetical protein
MDTLFDPAVYRTVMERLGRLRADAFFGRMSGAEWGVTQFKHADRPLRQFGAEGRSSARTTDQNDA